jgi:hypothetical protein
VLYEGGRGGENAESEEATSWKKEKMKNGNYT